MKRVGFEAKLTTWGILNALKCITIDMHGEAYLYVDGLGGIQVNKHSNQSKYRLVFKTVFLWLMVCFAIFKNNYIERHLIKTQKV